MKSQKISIDCATCKARTEGLCKGANSEELRKISTLKSGDTVVKSGQDIFSPGEECRNIYNLESGWVFIYSLLGDGRRQILHFAFPGAVLGFHPANGAKLTYGAQALTEVKLCIMPRENLGSISQVRPETGLQLAWLISRDRTLLYDHVTSIGQQSARERVAHLVLELYVRSRMQWPGPAIEELSLPLTQEHIGDATGLTGVHVNRVLHDLGKEGIVQLRYRKLKILDPDRLYEVAGTDRELMHSWIAQS